MLEVDELSVEVAGRRVLKSIALRIGEGELHVLFGPNGSGKTALLMTLMGVPRFQVVAGRIRFLGQDLTRLPPGERARRGLALFHQRPPTVHGVSLRQATELAARLSSRPTDLDALAARLHCSELLDRDLNAGFSGGESKLAELLQVAAQQPRLALIDEPDSGVDADNLGMVGAVLAELLGPGDRSALLITHSGLILDHLRPTHGHLLVEGRLVRDDEPLALLRTIQTRGYQGVGR